MRRNAILFLSLPLLVLVVLVSSIGLFTPDFYAKETPNWQAQALGQDMVDLYIIAPCLLLTSFFAYRGNRMASFMWGGTVLYLTYTFVLYCFDVHFNKLFVLYCFTLGLSFYSFVYFLLIHVNEKIVNHVKKAMRRTIGIYFISIAILFYVLWLSEILPAVLQNTTPENLTASGLFTNGVQVIDLSVVLPAIFLTGLFLLRKKPPGLLLTPVILTFFILMDLTIAVLALFMKMKGVGGDFLVGAVMICLALFSAALLGWYFKSCRAGWVNSTNLPS